jgi:hypothetical protein
MIFDSTLDAHSIAFLERKTKHVGQLVSSPCLTRPIQLKLTRPERHLWSQQSVSLSGPVCLAHLPVSSSLKLALVRQLSALVFSALEHALKTL